MKLFGKLRIVTVSDVLKIKGGLSKIKRKIGKLLGILLCHLEESLNRL